MHETPMTVDRALAVLGSLHECMPLESVAEHGDVLSDLVEQTKHGLSAAQRPFRIMIMGGTGVGKSTLLNALAGSIIAETGATRPTTEGFTVYMHSDESDPWLHTLHRASICAHSRSELMGKVIIDSPDVDSVLTEHRRLLEEALGLVDMALVVVTAEKYVSETVMRLIDRHRRGRSFAYVFNKRDLHPERTLLDDLYRSLGGRRSNVSNAEILLDEGVTHGTLKSDDTDRGVVRIFHISARAAVDARTTGGQPGEGFRELERWIGTELHRHQLSEIIRNNLSERIDMVTGFIRRILPADWNTVDDAWRNGCSARFADYLLELSGVLQRDLFRTRDIAEAIATARGSSFGGFYGIVSDVMYAVRSFRRSRLVPRIDGADQWVRMRMSQEEWKRIDSRDRLVCTTCIQFGKNLGISESFLNESFIAEWERREKAGEWMPPMCIKELSRNLERESTPPGFFFNCIVNIPGLIWFAYWLYRITEAVIHGYAPPWDAIPGAAILLIGFLVFQWWLTGRFLRWEAKRRSRRVVSAILSAIDARYLKHREVAVEAVATALRACIDRYQRALESLERNID